MGVRSSGYKNMYCPTALHLWCRKRTSGSKYNSFKVKLSARNSVYLNYKNMPLLQLILNFLPLFLGYVGQIFIIFLKKGWGKDYKDGVKEGLATMKAQKKVPFQFKHLTNYIVIEVELLLHTFGYARDWFSRKLFQK